MHTGLVLWCEVGRFSDALGLFSETRWVGFQVRAEWIIRCTLAGVRGVRWVGFKDWDSE